VAAGRATLWVPHILFWCYPLHLTASPQLQAGAGCELWKSFLTFILGEKALQVDRRQQRPQWRTGHAPCQSGHAPACVSL
jgi:hypothetical protein